MLMPRMLSAEAKLATTITPTIVKQIVIRAFLILLSYSKNGLFSISFFSRAIHLTQATTV
jgi:hypothetical protein